MMDRGDSKRALFVKSEAVRASAIDDLLSGSQHSWKVIFAADSKDAFALLEKEAPFDVVVASPSLPGLDAPTFLEDVGQRFPSIARVWFGERAVLDRLEAAERSQRALPGTNRLDGLDALLERSYALQRVITNPSVQAMVGQLDKLPSLPKTYWALMKAASEPRTSVTDIAKIIESDPAMSVRVLQLVNSAYFGLRRRVTSIQQAVTFLGLELLKALVLSAHVFTALDAREVGGFRPEQFQLYSFRVARIAQKLATDKAISDEAFTAGILHDIGQLALAVKQPAKFTEWLERTVEGTKPMGELEREIFGVGHEEVGATLLSAWGIPFSIVECVAWHHRPSAATGGDMQLLAVVHAASALTGIVTCGDPPESLDVAFLRRTGVEDRLADWRALVEDEAAAWTRS